jgi:uncharacterized protein (TIGR00730 family)
MIKRICVFCGSSPGAKSEYKEAAQLLGRLLAAENIGLVYGGAEVGLMGAIADAALQAGGEVIGVIPKHLVAKEVAHKSLTDLRVVDSMHERKALMAELSDGFIALPGGFGTFEELFEVVTWSQLGLHRKPTGLLNVLGYYDSLLQLLDQGVSEEFIRPGHRDLVLSSDDPHLLLQQMRDFHPPEIQKWISKSSET